MTKIVRILAAAAVVFAVATPVIAAPSQQVQSQAEKRLEDQRKALTRNWGG
jgi:hypothetical protein